MTECVRRMLPLCPCCSISMLARIWFESANGLIICEVGLVTLAQKVIVTETEDEIKAFVGGAGVGGCKCFLHRSELEWLLQQSDRVSHKHSAVWGVRKRNDLMLCCRWSRLKSEECWAAVTCAVDWRIETKRLLCTLNLQRSQDLIRDIQPLCEGFELLFNHLITGQSAFRSP